MNKDKVFRKVTVDDIKIHIVKPSIEDSRKADWEYTKTYNDSMLAGIQTETQMITLLNERNIWTSKDDDGMNEIRTLINDEVGKLVNNPDLSSEDKQSLKQSITINRIQLMAKHNALQKYLSHTCESKADEARLLFLAQKCVKRGDAADMNYWQSLDELKEDVNQDFIQSVLRELIMFMNDMPSDINDMFPENKVIIDDDNDEDNVVEEVQKEQPKAKPKTARKVTKKTKSE